MNIKITSPHSIFFIATFIFTILLIPANLFAQTGNKIVPVIELKGNDHERGLQHGKQLKKEIAEVYNKWKENIKASLNADPDSTIAAFLSATNFEPITRKYVPGMLDELRGIAEGSGQKFNDVFAFQLVDEF